MAKRKPADDTKIPTKLAETATRPNKPSFDFSPETGEPKLLKGETILVQKMKAGVPLYVTSGGRTIFVCSIADYETKFHALVKRNIYEFYYPHATKKVKKFKLAAEPGEAMAETTAATGGGGGVDE